MTSEQFEPPDPLQAAQHLVETGHPETAEALLLEFAATMPGGWQPVTDTPKRRLVAAWSLADFLAAAARGNAGDRAVAWQGPSYSRAWCAVARIRRERGDSTGALEAVERSLALEPGHPAALLERGAILAELGRRDEARSDWRRVEESGRTTPGQRELARGLAGRTGPATKLSNDSSQRRK